MGDGMGGELWVGPTNDPDRYALYAVVGRGAEGKVYRGTRKLRDGTIDVAVKVMRPDRFGAYGEPVEEVAARWEAQAARLHDVQATGLVGVHEAFLGAPPHPRGVEPSGRQAYFVMAWVDGHDLATWLTDRPTSNVTRLTVLTNVADALDAMHDANLVHADVKPGNVVVKTTELESGPVPVAVLVDFGVMRTMTGARPSQVTRSLGYTAPELLEGAPYSQLTDLYALAGVVLFALTGDHPPSTDDVDDVPAAARERLAAVGISSPTIGAIAAALDQDPAHRPDDGCGAWLARARNGLSSSVAKVAGPIPGELPAGGGTAPTDPGEGFPVAPPIPPPSVPPDPVPLAGYDETRTFGPALHEGDPRRHRR